MKKYLLDTHILIWLLNGDERLNKNLREDIDYFQHFYYVSVESLREIVILQSLKKINFDFSVEKIVTTLTKRSVEIIHVEVNHIKTLEKLPVLKSLFKFYTNILLCLFLRSFLVSFWLIFSFAQLK